MTLRDRNIFITGGSRGIGLAIALRAARDGANVAIAAKTSEPHKYLPGTIFSAAAEIEDQGGRALPLLVDVRDDEALAGAIKQTANTFGGIDIIINNASAISRTPVTETERGGSVRLNRFRPLYKWISALGVMRQPRLAAAR